MWKSLMILGLLICLRLVGCTHTPNPEEQFQLGKKYEYGLDVSLDYLKAIELYKKAAEAGNPKALLRLGKMYYGGGTISIPKDSEYANKLFCDALPGLLMLAEKDDAEAQFLLYYMYKRDIGEKVDNNMAEKLLKRSLPELLKRAESGDKLALANLSSAWFFEIDSEYKIKIINLLKKAAKDFPYAQYILSSISMTRAKTSDDKRKAIRLIIKSAQQGGYSSSQLELANALYTYYPRPYISLGIPKNDHEAAELYQKCIDQGEAVALIYLSEMYFDGTGVSRDMSKGCDLLRIASQQKFDDDLIRKYDTYCVDAKNTNVEYNQDKYVNGNYYTIRDIYKKEHSNFYRGEFEGLGNYEKRIEKFVQLTDSMHLEFGPEASIKYDIDSGIFTATLSISPVYSQITIDSHQRLDPPLTHKTTYYIKDIDDLKLLNAVKFGGELTLKFKCEEDEAKAIGSNLAIRVLCTPCQVNGKYVKHSSPSDYPSIRPKPPGVKIDEYTLNVKNIKIHIIDTVSNKIYFSTDEVYFSTDDSKQHIE